MEPKFKIGQFVLPKPNFSAYPNDQNYGGAGWSDPIRMMKCNIPYLIIISIVQSAKISYGFKTASGREWTNGIYEFALESLDDVRLRKINEII